MKIALSMETLIPIYMKNFLLAAFGLLFLAASCVKEDGGKNNNDDQISEASLVEPEINVQMAEPLSQQAFSGALEIYPCNNGSSIYFGNYISGKLSVFNGFYMIVDGNVSGQYNRELHLPIGDYNMVYWGTPKYDEPIHNAPQIVSPGLSEGADLSKLYFTLRSIGNELYSPVYDLVYAVKPAHIGTDALQASLTRISAGLKVIVKQSDGSAFTQDITSVKVNIGNIAEKVNFYTAQAENMTKTIQFELARSEDGLSYQNATVMLFPSAENPPLELIITLQDGTVFRLQENLTSTLSSNTRLTLNISVGKILPDGNPGDFTYDQWHESNENIDFPIVD